MGANTITVQPNQSMQDVIIQATGSMEAGMQFCNDNNVSISDTPPVGMVYAVSAAALALGNSGNRVYFMQNAVVPGTLGYLQPEMLMSEGGSDALFSEDGSEIFVTEDSGV